MSTPHTNERPDTNAVVRAVRPADADGLRSNCFPELLADAVAGRIRHSLKREREGTGGCLVACVDGEIAATAMVVCRERRVGHLCNVIVAPSHRRRGLLRRLTNELATLAARLGSKRLRVSVERDNAVALKAYARLGFAEVDATHDIIWLEAPIKRD